VGSQATPVVFGLVLIVVMMLAPGGAAQLMRDGIALARRGGAK
jgi:hypothetical protein